jgi:hypothetical protein
LTRFHGSRSNAHLITPVIASIQLGFQMGRFS